MAFQEETAIEEIVIEEVVAPVIEEVVVVEAVPEVLPAGVLNRWSELLAKWAGRKDILYVRETQGEAIYASVSLLAADGKLAYVGNSGDDEGEVRFAYAPLPADVVPVFTVTEVEYGRASLGSKLFPNMVRWFERKDVKYVAGDIDIESQKFVCAGMWDRQNSADGVLYVPTNEQMNFVGDEAINSVVDQVVQRINSNKGAMDGRAEKRAGGVMTAYGEFRAQGKKDADARKQAKKTAQGK